MLQGTSFTFAGSERDLKPVYSWHAYFTLILPFCKRLMAMSESAKLGPCLVLFFLMMNKEMLQNGS